MENNVICEGWELYCQSDELITIWKIWLKFEYLYRMLNNMFPIIVWGWGVAAWEKVNEIFDVDFYIATQVFSEFSKLISVTIINMFLSFK